MIVATKDVKIAGVVYHVEVYDFDFATLTLNHVQIPQRNWTALQDAIAEVVIQEAIEREKELPKTGERVIRL